mmetsp:Transcript_22673/g.52932  ORF Transcript_22673/g.52932 Transcript_22673/m.52932 type:complete len:353 (-) Transcript_22673:9-1067(-)
MGCGPITPISSELETTFSYKGIDHTAELTVQASKIGLHVVTGETEASSPLRRWPHGAWFSEMKVGERLTILELTPEPSFSTMGFRQEQHNSSKGGIDPSTAWPNIPRCTVEKEFWRARVSFEDDAGRTLMRTYVLQVATSPGGRSQKIAEADLNDAKDAAMYAHEFNKHMLTANGQSLAHEAKPGVQVCIPIICEVIDSTSCSVCIPGDIVLLIPYPAQEVQKFVCTGTEEFFEVPQAFFHFAAWWSSFNEFVCDLQGAESADGGFLLIDPLILRTFQQPLGELLGIQTLFSTEKPVPNADEAVGPSLERFNFTHRKCGALCKSFDASRSVGKGWRGAIGAGLWQCGVLTPT